MDEKLQLDTLKLLNSIRDDKKLSSTEKVVAYSLALHRNSKTMLCCPAQTKLAEETGFAPVTVSRATMSMQQKGFVVLLRVSWKGNTKYKYYFTSELDDGFKISRNPKSALCRNGEKKDLLAAIKSYEKRKIAQAQHNAEPEVESEGSPY